MTRAARIVTILLGLSLAACGGDGGDGDPDGGGAEVDAGSADVDAGGAADPDGGGSGDPDAGGSDSDGGAGDVDAGAGEDAGAAADAGTPPPGATRTYLLRRDYRRCAYPLCGGWWLQEVNATSTTCFDGTTADECYVVEIDWSASGYDARAQERVSGARAALLDGRIVTGTFADTTLGGFEADAAWIAEWDPMLIPPSTERFHGLSDNGMRCFVDPCFSNDVVELNTGAMDAASGVDLTGTGASRREQDAGLAALSEGTLRATGQVVRDDAPGTSGEYGETYVATQFFLPL